MHNNRKLILLFLFVLSLIIRLYNYTKQPVEPDEFIAYSEYAFSLLANGWEWTYYWMLINPPLFPSMLALMTYFIGDGGLSTLRLLPIIFGSLSVCMIYLLGEMLYNKKVGLFSALILTFYSYHIYYSRAVMLEAPVIFFMITSTYFFYKCYIEFNKKNIILSGIFLGLALITKYIVLFLYVAYFLSVIWTREKKVNMLKAMFGVFFVSIIVASPVLILLYEGGVNPIETQILQSESGIRNPAMPKMGIFATIQNGLNKLMLLLTDGDSQSTQTLPSDWIGIYKIATISVFIVVILLYFYWLINDSKFNDRLIFMYFMVYGVFIALYPKKHDYYFLWVFVIYFIMISKVFFKFIADIKKTNTNFSFKNIFKFFFIFCVMIFSFTYLVTGIYAPAVNQGYEGGHKIQVESIIQKLEPGDSIASIFPPVTSYYFNNFFNKYVTKINIKDLQVYPLYTLQNDMYHIKGLDVPQIEENWPRYLITDYLAYKYFTDSSDKSFIQDNYELVSNQDSVLLYERKVQHAVSNTEVVPEKSAVIDKNLFRTSVPQLMVVGNSYRIQVRITNTGTSFESYLLKLSAPLGIIYPYEKYDIIQLGQGTSQDVEFPITPTKQQYMPTNLTVSLYLIEARAREPTSVTKLDEITQQIRGIKSAYK